MNISIPYPPILRISEEDEMIFSKSRAHTFYLDCDQSIYLENLLMLSQIISNWETQESIIAEKLKQDKDEYGWMNYLNTISMDFFCTNAGIAITRGTIEKEYSVYILERFMMCDTQAKMLLHPKAYDAIKGRLIYSLMSANHKMDAEKSISSYSMKSRSRISLAVVDFVHPEMYKLLTDHPWVWLIAAYQIRPLLSSVLTASETIKE